MLVTVRTKPLSARDRKWTRTPYHAEISQRYVKTDQIRIEGEMTGGGDHRPNDVFVQISIAPSYFKNIAEEMTRVDRAKAMKSFCYASTKYFDSDEGSEDGVD